MFAERVDVFFNRTLVIYAVGCVMVCFDSFYFAIDQHMNVLGWVFDAIDSMAKGAMIPVHLDKFKGSDF